MSFAKHAFGREKPHSSVTDWVEILTGSGIAEEAYDGIPELVDAINLQPAAGPAEASRAIRKKLKHGNSHQQYRALVILKALVENCGDKFTKTSFADGHLTDAIKHIAANPDGQYDKRVQKKLRLVLLSWHEQFKGDPSMSVVANLYSQCKAEKEWMSEANQILGFENASDAKRKAKDEKLKRKQEEEERKRQQKSGRVPFDFERDKPKVLSSIVEASQASSNLVNAITLVNRETDSLSTNERVQECLNVAKQARKQIVRYIQLVEKEEIIGTLIEVNDRIISALEMYDQLSTADSNSSNAEDGISTGLSGVHIASEVSKLQDKQRAAVERAKQNGSTHELTSDPYHDLHDLNFGGPIGGSSSNLPAPLEPHAVSSNISDDEGNDIRASLSDFSDYESSDEETHQPSSSSWRQQVHVSNDSDEAVGITKPETDPFADPFADEVAVGPARK